MNESISSAQDRFDSLTQDRKALVESLLLRRNVSSPELVAAHGADAAAHTIVPINQVGEPGAPLPARLPDTGFGSTPLPSQVPSPLRALR